jgi:AraC family transcriptional activator of pobA
MGEIYSKSGEYLLGLVNSDEVALDKPAQHAEYSVIFLPEGEGIYHADFGMFPFKGPVLLFATPIQFIHLELSKPGKFIQLKFHGDFYCIEYHRAEVSCNGLLFNNIYIEPAVNLCDREAAIFEGLFEELSAEFSQPNPSEIVLRAYLQLFLAKSSSIKMKAMAEEGISQEKDGQMEKFRLLLDAHYLTLHTPGDYANLLAMSSNTFTKRCTRYFKKTPSQLIQERLILEAKRQLHLTRQSIKEIAYNLHFQDEFYFSRVFKKFTKVSPQTFRDKTGISIVADLSK